MQHNAFDCFGLDRAEYLIEVSKEDASAYACNGRCVDNTVVMPECSEALQEKLRTHGYDVITTDMSQFIHTGGAIHCVTNTSADTRLPGGTIQSRFPQQKPAASAPGKTRNKKPELLRAPAF